MSFNRAHDERVEREKREAVELCGKNRGPHDYIPIEWVRTVYGDITTGERVVRLLCRTCFCSVSTKTLLERYPELSY